MAQQVALGTLAMTWPNGMGEEGVYHTLRNKGEAIPPTVVLQSPPSCQPRASFLRISRSGEKYEMKGQASNQHSLPAYQDS